MTTTPSRMQAQEWALASLWENIGMHGPSLETGSLRDATSDGLKQSPLSSLPACSPPFSAQTITSDAMGTIPESSKDGGRVPARTPKPMPSSGAYMTSQNQQGSISTPVMCLASTTQQMLPHKEFWDPPIESFPLSPSPVLSGPSFEMCQRLQLGLGTIALDLPDEYTTHDGAHIDACESMQEILALTCKHKCRQHWCVLAIVEHSCNHGVAGVVV